MRRPELPEASAACSVGGGGGVREGVEGEAVRLQAGRGVGIRQSPDVRVRVRVRARVRVGVRV